MTREEALQFFGEITEDEIEDAYEEQLFEYKQFFLSKAPIAKLFESRIRKLGKLGEAYAALAGPFPVSSFQGKYDLPEGEAILNTFQSFQKAKNELKRLISNTSSAEELVLLAESLLALEKENASHWNTAPEDDAEIIVSKEPDPMYLLEAIQAYRQHGGETFTQLKNLENNPPEVLIQEMKRLSLLFKKF